MAKVMIALTDRDDAIKINNALEDRGDRPYIATDSSALIEKINKKEFKVLILDIDIIPELELNIVKFLKERNPNMEVILAASKEKIDNAINIAGRENFNYLTKPVNIHELEFIMDKLVTRIEATEMQPQPDIYFKNIFIGQSEKVKKVMALAQKVSKSDSNIMVTGETGTGKELISRSIHELSIRSNKPFIAVNCAAIPENLLESELFGYKKGAFTGAVTDKKGLIELADTGTLFLDEIGDLSLILQAKLLRVLEYKELRRLGDEDIRTVDIRIIAATNQDINEQIKVKKFREDLFYRLNVININIPPLRERKEDIPLLLRFYLERYNKINNRNILGIEAKAKAVLMFYDYPGNVRELDNIIQHAFAMSQTDQINLDDLPVHLRNLNPYYRLEAYEGDKSKLKIKAVEHPDLLLSEVEKMTILKAFDRFGKNHTEVAQVLGISRSTLWRKMKEYKIK
jgi:two-component system, NtrC family, response regulator AtoC